MWRDAEGFGGKCLTCAFARSHKCTHTRALSLPHACDGYVCSGSALCAMSYGPLEPCPPAANVRRMLLQAGHDFKEAEAGVRRCQSFKLGMMWKYNLEVGSIGHHCSRAALTAPSLWAPFACRASFILALDRSFLWLNDRQRQGGAPHAQVFKDVQHNNRLPQDFHFLSIE